VSWLFFLSKSTSILDQAPLAAIKVACALLISKLAVLSGWIF
jgi:hypothetical protein